jgi:hypothetical protein
MFTNIRKQADDSRREATLIPKSSTDVTMDTDSVTPYNQVKVYVCF